MARSTPSVLKLMSSKSRLRPITRFGNILTTSNHIYPLLRIYKSNNSTSDFKYNRFTGWVTLNCFWDCGLCYRGEIIISPPSQGDNHLLHSVLTTYVNGKNRNYYQKQYINVAEMKKKTSKLFGNWKPKFYALEAKTGKISCDSALVQSMIYVKRPTNGRVLESL